MSRKRLVCLVGPTGTGKSALALKLAETFRGGIINADSRQVFRAFPIITAQPTAEEQSLCQHRLYGFLDTESRISAGTWAEKALTELDTFAEQGVLPLLAGGTGLYLRALLDGMVEIPALPDIVLDRLVEECAERGSEVLHARLAGIDPDYAARIHPNDRQRILRALGVFEVTGKRFSWWHSQTPPPPDMDVLRIGLRLPLDALAPRLTVRIDQMLASGAWEEARAAYAQNPNVHAPGWSGIGCVELHACLSGTLSLADACALWVKNTRAYAKRQLTWFNADKRILWFTPNETQGVLEAVASFCA